MTTEARQRNRGGGGTRARTSARLAWVVCALTLSVLALVLLVILLGWSTLLPQGRIPPWRAQAISLVGLVGAPVLGGLIAARRPGNPYGWLWLGFGLGLALQLLAQSYAAYALVVEPGSLVAPRTIPRVLALGGTLALSCAPFLLLLFPTGRLPSRRWRPVGWIAGISGAMLVVLNALFNGPENVGGTITILVVTVVYLIFAVVALSALSLVVRYRRARGVERQQLKWFALAAVLTGASLLADLSLDKLLGSVLLSLFDCSAIAGLYVAVGVAILRYRLYYIDILINRTLVYGSLTAMLVALYLGGVVGLQRLLSPLVGESSGLATVASTLAIAALFNPLRRRVQAFVDRRFYRRKYDAAKTLEAFNSRLRDETDLDALSTDLVGVASATMQPAHVSLWLRPDPEPKARSAALRQFGHDEE